MPLRICILETDHLRPELVDAFTSYGQMFKRLFADQPIEAEFETFNVVDGHYPPEDRHYDAYLVTGSKADSFGSDPWIQTLKAYLLKRYENGDKLLGICFGHQLLALLLGGRTERAQQGWGVGVHQYHLEAREPWMQPALDDLSLLISHRDQVVRPPKNATILASSAFCPVAAFRIDDRVLCFQGHPEFVVDYSKALLDARQDTLGETLYQQALSTLDQTHHGKAVGEWMLRFVSQGRQKHPA